MADVASRFLIKAMITKNSRMLAGLRPPPRGVSLYGVHEETIRLRKILSRHEAEIVAAAAAKRKRLPYPSDFARPQEARTAL